MACTARDTTLAGGRGPQVTKSDSVGVLIPVTGCKISFFSTELRHYFRNRWKKYKTVKVANKSTGKRVTKIL